MPMGGRGLTSNAYWRQSELIRNGEFKIYQHNISICIYIITSYVHDIPKYLLTMLKSLFGPDVSWVKQEYVKKYL